MSLARRLIEAVAGGEHDRLTVIVEFLQQPLLEAVGAVHRERGHQIERALRAFAHNAGNFLESGDDGVAAAAVFLTDGLEVVRADAVKRGGRDLVERGDRKTRLAVFKRLREELFIAADKAADARTAGGKAL